MATLKSNLKAALGWTWACAIVCIVIVLTVCVWVVQFAGPKVAIHALWPSLGEAASPVAAIVGLAMTLLVVFGAEAAKNMIEEDREKHRDLRWKEKRAVWFASLRQKNKSGWELEEIYWVGTELLEEFASARNNKEFNQALDAVAAELKENGLDVGHENRKIATATH